MSTAVVANLDLKAALADARDQYTAHNPQSRAQYEEACGAFPGGNTRSVLFYPPYPLTMVCGESAYLWDLDGHQYIDFLGEYTAGLYGHSHPVIRAAIDMALDKGIVLGAHNALEAKFAAAICARFPSIALVRFTNSGTEANLMAISAARTFTKRKKILVFNGAYHGGVFFFAGGGSPINAPFDFVVARYNELDYTLALLEKNASDLAAVVMEPMMGVAGCIPAERSFLQAIRDATRKQEIILIFDEVMTSRLSSGGLQQVHDVLPDITTLGKYLGGGMSFGAFGGRRDIMEQFDPRRSAALPHAGTFNNNVLTMSAGHAGLTQIYTPSIAAQHNDRGDRLRQRLNDLVRKSGVNMQFTGLGSMMNVHMRGGLIRTVADVEKGNAELRELFFFDLIARGLWLAQRGMIILSIPMTDGDCNKFVAGVEEFIDIRKSLLTA